MEWSGTEYQQPRLGVRRMALALVLAAFLGGALGLIWHRAFPDTGDEEEEEAASADEAAEGASAP